MRLSTRTVRLKPGPYHSVCLEAGLCHRVRVDGRGRRAEHGRDPRLVAQILPGVESGRFLKGDVENLSIDSHGRLVLVPPPS